MKRLPPIRVGCLFPLLLLLLFGAVYYYASSQRGVNQTGLALFFVPVIVALLISLVQGITK